MTNKHPIQLAVPRLTLEEVDSLRACEGVVELDKAEIGRICESEWFKSQKPVARTFFVAYVYDWAAKGSNQYVRRINPRSPRAAARAASTAIARASHA